MEDISDEPIPTPETYEDYIKLSDACLQKDDVIQALAVLDEGEILSGRVLDCDEHGNEIKDLYYDRGEKSTGVRNISMTPAETR